MHSKHFCLWLEASVRRVGGATARLTPPFSRVVTAPAHAVWAANFINGAPDLEIETSGVASRARRRQGGDARKDDDGERGRAEARGSRRRTWRKRSPRSRGAPGVKEGTTWVPRTLSKIPRSLGRGAVEQGEGTAEHAGEGVGPRGEDEGYAELMAKACVFDELWLPPGLLALAQDVLLINRARGGVVPRGGDRYFIAQARGAPDGTASDSGHPLWKPAEAKFRGLEAAVFPFLLLPLVPSQHQPQAAGQLSRLLDANPANAATLCHLRVPLALLKLACLLPDQSQQHMRDLYFRLAAQLMSHHMSPADALELFHLASLEPSAWARLGRFRVASEANLVQTGDCGLRRVGQGGLTLAEEGGADRVRLRSGHGGGGVAIPPHSGELQMQLLYVIGTVVDSPSPAWFFHMDGGAGSGLVAGPLARLPPQRMGYSVSMWLRPALFSGGSGSETALFSMSGRKEDGTNKTYLRVSLRRCLRPGESSAPPAAAGIGASEDDDQGTAADDASAVVHIRATTEDGLEQGSSSDVVCDSRTASGFMGESEVRCGRWQNIVVTHSSPPEAASTVPGQWMDGSITAYLDGERRMLSVETPGMGVKHAEPARGMLAYPAAAGGGSGGGGAGNVSVSVGCWEDDNRLEPSTTNPSMHARGGSVASRFSGQMATVAIVEGAWTAETAKAAFLRGPGAPPPGKRMIFTGPGDLPPTPFLDSVDGVDGLDRAAQAGPLDQGESASRSETSAGVDEVAIGGASLGDGESREGDSRVPDAAEAGDKAPARSSAASGAGQAAAHEPSAGAAPFAAVRTTVMRDAACSRALLSLEAGDPPGLAVPPPKHNGATRLAIMFSPLRRAIDDKYGIAVDQPSVGGHSLSTAVVGGAVTSERGRGDVSDMLASVDSAVGDASSALSESMASLAVAAGCGGSKDSTFDKRDSFRLAGRGTWVYATTPLHAAVQAAGGFRLCLPFLRMDHARQVRTGAVGIRHNLALCYQRVTF